MYIIILNKKNQAEIMELLWNKGYTFAKTKNGKFLEAVGHEEIILYILSSSIEWNKMDQLVSAKSRYKIITIDELRML